MHDGRYEHVTSLFSKVDTDHDAQQLTERFVERFDERDANGKLINDMETWSVRGLYEAFRNADIRADRDPDNIQESQGTSSFTQAISGLVAKKILQSHDDISNNRKIVGQNLVRVVPTKKKSEKVLRFSSHPLFKVKPEGVDIQPFELAEAYYGYSTARFARSVKLTEELVMFDQTDQIWQKAIALGESAALSKEYLILHSVLDLQGSHQMGYWDAAEGGVAFYVYRPSDAVADMYSASSPSGAAAGNLITSNGLVDWTDLQNCKSRLNGFYDDTPEKLNDNIADGVAGKRMVPSLNRMLLIPEALEEKAYQIFGAGGDPFTAENRRNPAAPGGPLHARFLCSNILDEQSASTWYYGDFARQFEYREVFPFRTLQAMRRDSLELMRKGLYGEAIGEFYAGVAAMDNRNVIMCTA